MLEKILKDINLQIEKHKNKAFALVAREPLRQCYTETDVEQMKVDALAAARDIIRKHMNDGWIPVEKRLPTEEERIGGYDRGIPGSRRLEVAYMTDTVEYTFGYYDGFKFYDKRHRKIKNVIAWKIHEPYRPKKGTE